MPTPAVGRLRGRQSCDNPTPGSSAACYRCRRSEGLSLAGKLLPCSRGRRCLWGMASLGSWALAELNLSDRAARHAQRKPPRRFHHRRRHERGGSAGISAGCSASRRDRFLGRTYYLLDLLRGVHDTTAAGTLRLGPGGDLHAWSQARCVWLRWESSSSGLTWANKLHEEPT
jgi:hypothetical protein